MKHIPPLIKLNRVTLIRDGHSILKDISWTVKRGEHWFILGHNGAGKTSLLELVMGYQWASLGTVEVLGEAYGKTNLPELRKRIGYAAPWIAKHIKPQEIVKEVAAGGLEATIEYHKAMDSAALNKIQKALSLMESVGFMEAPFSRLSSGEQLKVLIARAIVNEPEILILDEPFSSLDIGSRHSIHELVENLGSRHQKTSILIVTHHFDDIYPFYTHGLILRQGTILKKGLKSQVLTSSVIKSAFGVEFGLSSKSGRFFLS